MSKSNPTMPFDLLCYGKITLINRSIRLVSIEDDTKNKKTVSKHINLVSKDFNLFSY